jgi:hypothetical protein
LQLFCFVANTITTSKQTITKKKNNKYDSHAAGVHSATIQPEPSAALAASRACLCIDGCSERKCC